MSAIMAVARERLRRRRAATLALVVLAGIAAAVPMAVWAAGRQAATSVERFIERANVADVSLILCPPGYDLDVEVDLGPCFAHDADDELEVVRSLSHVEQAARGGFSPAVGGPSGDPATWRPLGVLGLSDRVSTATVVGDPIVVAGRLAAVEAPDEVMVSEPAARSLGVDPGDRLWMRPAETGEARPAVVATVVGVIRTPTDLLPISLESAGGPPLFARAGWVGAHDAQFPSFRALAVWLDDRDVDGFMGRLRRELDDQAVRSEAVVPPGERDNLEQATDLESRAGLATASVAALAAAFFVGQAVSRQARSEASDAPTLLALGMTRRQLAAAAAMRWAPVALGATVLATAGALGASALGPIGVARRGPWDRAVHADWPVLAIGAVTVAALVMFVAVTAAARRRGGDSTAGGTATAPALLGSPGLRTGIGLAWRSLGRGGALPVVSVVVATALAIAMVITAAGAAASLRLVTTHPVRFGAPWDALIEGAGDDAGAVLAETTGVAAAAWIAGTELAIGDDPQVWTQALIPIAGVEPTRPVIISGREPVTDDEIALGSLTLRRADADVGDEVSLKGQSGGAPLRYRVVGVTMVTDGFEPNVGHGAIVTPDGLERIDPSATEFLELAVRVVDGPGRAEGLDELRAAFPGAQVPFPVPSSLANAERVAGLPLLLAAGAAAVAAITLTHALIMSIRRNRRDLAVCRVLGFTRGQVHTAVATQATLLALAAAVLGVPLGLAGARWGWRAMSASFGVASGPIVPVWVVAASAFAALLVANLAAVPARMAARLRPADALRTE